MKTPRDLHLALCTGLNMNDFGDIFFLGGVNVAYHLLPMIRKTNLSNLKYKFWALRYEFSATSYCLLQSNWGKKRWQEILESVMIQSNIRKKSSGYAHLSALHFLASQFALKHAQESHGHYHISNPFQVVLIFNINSTQRNKTNMTVGVIIDYAPSRLIKNKTKYTP